MLDIGWQELFIIAVIAIVVIGPKELPRAVRTVARLLRKARSMAREFQDGIDDLVREAELDDIKREITESSPTSIGRQIENTIDPTGDLKDAVRGVDPTADVRDALDTTEKPSPAASPAAKTVEPKDEPLPAAAAANPIAEDEAEPVAERQAGG